MKTINNIIAAIMALTLPSALLISHDRYIDAGLVEMLVIFAIYTQLGRGDGKKG